MSFALSSVSEVGVPEIVRRILFERLEAQRATERHHLAFYPQVTISLALENRFSTNDAVLLPISTPVD
jgi:hypothetical protein